MRTLIVSVLTFALGCAAGWYFGYTRPVARNSWRVAQITRWTPMKISEAFNSPDKTFRDLLGTQEEAVARASLLALSWLERGENDRVKDYLAQRIADYYVAAHALDTSSEAREKFHQRIEEISEISPTLKRRISETK